MTDARRDRAAGIVVRAALAVVVILVVALWATGRALSVDDEVLWNLDHTAEVTIVGERATDVPGFCRMVFLYEHPLAPEGHQVNDYVPCAWKPEVGDVVSVWACPWNPWAVLFPHNVWARGVGVLLLWLLVLGAVLGLLRRAGRKGIDWVGPTLAALKAEGIEARRLSRGGISVGSEGVFDKSGEAMSISVGAEGLPDCHISRATVLPGESLEVGLDDFDRQWRLKTPLPLELALALSERARKLMDRVDGCEIRQGTMRVWGAQGHPSTFIRHALKLRAALTTGLWGELEIAGLERLRHGFTGEIDGLPVSVSLRQDGPEVHTLVHVQVKSSFQAAREGLWNAEKTGNVVVDQLIQLSGHCPQLEDEAFVGLLLEVVHGHGGVVHKNHLAVEKPGILADELVELVDTCVRLARQLR